MHISGSSGLPYIRVAFIRAIYPEYDQFILSWSENLCLVSEFWKWHDKSGNLKIVVIAVFRNALNILFTRKESICVLFRNKVQRNLPLHLGLLLKITIYSLVSILFPLGVNPRFHNSSANSFFDPLKGIWASWSCLFCKMKHFDCKINIFSKESIKFDSSFIARCIVRRN